MMKRIAEASPGFKAWIAGVLYLTNVPPRESLLIMWPTKSRTVRKHRNTGFSRSFYSWRTPFSAPSAATTSIKRIGMAWRSLTDKSCPIVMRHRYKSCPAEMTLRWPRTLIRASAESTLPLLVLILFESRSHRMPVPHSSFRAASQSLRTAQLSE